MLDPQVHRLTPAQIEVMTQALGNAYLGHEPPQSQEARLFFENEIFRRYHQSLEHAVPWVARQIDLRGKTILDIGCGSGSSTSAFAHFAGQVIGYDINEVVLRGARARAAALGQTNVRFFCISPDRLTAALRENHSQGVDVVLLFAVLEHCTPLECLDLLETAWSLLRPGGLLVVIETPNRLTYRDEHTTLLPFFHLLPPEIALRYYPYSPRAEFVQTMQQAATVSPAALQMELTRQGKGISYHEFQLGLHEVDLGNLLVSDGYEPEILRWMPGDLEEKLLQTYFINQSLDIPIGFARHVLNLIFRKPLDPAAPNPARAQLALRSRLPYLTNYLDLEATFVKTRRLDTPVGLARFVLRLFWRKALRLGRGGK